MKYLLDTNVISELRRKKPHGAVVEWIRQVAEQDLAISVVTLAEIQADIEITREQDTKKANELEIWLDLISQSYNILPMDTHCFRSWARVMHRKSDTLYEDAMIASTAIVNNLTVVTRNISDFKNFEVPLYNPFDGSDYLSKTIKK